MNRLKTALLTSFMLLTCTSIAQAQLSTVVVVDFERAVVESAEGKKSSEKFNAALQAKQTEMEKKQKEIEELQRKLQTGTRTLSETAKTELQRDIDRKTTDFQRLNEDTQKELGLMRDELLRPIAERATDILNSMAAEQAYTVVIDLSNPDNNVVWFNEKNDITAELIKRLDATAPKPATPAAPPPPTPTTPPKP